MHITPVDFWRVPSIELLSIKEKGNLNLQCWRNGFSYSVAANLHYTSIQLNGKNIELAKGNEKKKLLRMLNKEKTYTEFVEKIHLYTIAKTEDPIFLTA